MALIYLIETNPELTNLKQFLGSGEKGDRFIFRWLGAIK
jgi:hypothetical protein